MNGIGERELPDTFSRPEYRLLLVAEKYQTGFDQPLLHTMYVDKKLAGVHAVQTLSRLNRIYPGKEDTFIMDFVNEPEVILAAFQPFYESASLEDNPDPNQIYDLRTKLDVYGVARIEEVEAFARVFFKPRASQSASDSRTLNGTIDPAVERWREFEQGAKDQFKHLLAEFIRLYGFISQIAPFSDPELEKYYAYARLLTTKIRDNSFAARFQLQDEIVLEYYRLQKISEGAIVLEAKGEAALGVSSELGTGQAQDEEARLSAIIAALNERFGTDFNAADQLFFDQIEHDLASDEKLAQQAKINTIDNFKFPFNDVFIDKVIGRMEQNQEITDRLMNEEEFAEAVRDFLLRKVYARLQSS